MTQRNQTVVHWNRASTVAAALKSIALPMNLFLVSPISIYLPKQYGMSGNRVILKFFAPITGNCPSPHG